jgi:hypothetical protein
VRVQWWFRVTLPRAARAHPPAGGTKATVGPDLPMRHRQWAAMLPPTVHLRHLADRYQRLR